MKKSFLLLSLFVSIYGAFSQEYVQTTTNPSFANKSFRTTGKFSLGLTGAESAGGSLLNIKTKWGNWMAFVDGYKSDVYAFHNPNNGGRMELFVHDGVTGANKFGVFTVKRDGNIGIGTSNPQEKLHVNGSIRGASDGGSLRISTGNGWLDLGPKSSSFAHIYTDRPKIIFNKDVYTTSNAFSSYNNDLILKTKGAERLRIDDINGNVGIGTNTPQEKLHVNGNTLIKGSLTTEQLLAKSSSSTNWAPLSVGRPTKSGSRNFNFVVSPDNVANEYLAFELFDKNKVYRSGIQATDNKTVVGTRDSNNGEIFKIEHIEERDFAFFHMPKSSSRVVIGDYGGYLEEEGHKLVIKNGTAMIENAIYTNGTIGIGTTDTPNGYKLAVAGKVIAEEVRIRLQANWPDYVFKEDYKLPSLKETENHIIQKGHLINIPSATEVAKEGIQLGEMNAKLLEKIEELTLYTIAQDKEIKELQQVKVKNAELEARLAKIEAFLEKNSTK